MSAFGTIDRTFERIGGLGNNAVDAGSPARLIELRIDFDLIWYVDIALAVGAALLHLPIREARLTSRMAAV